MRLQVGCTQRSHAGRVHAALACSLHVVAMRPCKMVAMALACGMHLQMVAMALA